MKAKGSLLKLKSQQDDPIVYELPVGDHCIDLNAQLGKRLMLAFTGQIVCIQCGRKTNKSFHQGHCYPCFRRLAECNFCTIHPERCLCEQQTCPSDDWAHSQCYQTHIIYIANTSGLKVGITRHDQVPTRWIDQGATQALPIMQVSNRYQAGLLEVALKAFVADKTNWRQMLKADNHRLDLKSERDQLLDRAREAIQQSDAPIHYEAIQFLDESVHELQYPVEQFPTKIKSHHFDKSPQVGGMLQGIKGQYLILDTGVINIRKFGGYEVAVETD